MKKPALIILLVLVTACGVRPTPPITGGAAPTEELTGSVLYLLDGVTLTRVVRPATIRTTNLELLAEGPTPEEQAEGLTTQVPPYASPITATPTSTGITVRIASPLRYLSRTAQAQLTCTALPPDGDQQTPITLTDPEETLPPQTCPFEG
jgi:hypothetical protein